MSDDPLIGATVGSYQVTSRLGQGGMGAVYELVHPGIGKRLAMKLLHAEHSQKPDIVQRFFDEARAVNVIGHPNIVDIIDFSALPDGRSYILMEFLEGEALNQLIHRRERLPHDEVRDIALQICSALQAAHEAGITHRDLKPENIHVRVGADGRFATKVLDFGIAKLSDHLRVGGQQRATVTGIVMGTPLYMSPEQAAGHTNRIDHRTDVYALGCILYELLSGDVPFDGDTFPALIMQHMNDTARPLSQVRRDVPREWEAVVERAMSKDPAARFQSMNELAAAIVAIYAPEGEHAGGRRGLFLPVALGVIVLATAAMIAFILIDSEPTIEDGPPPALVAGNAADSGAQTGAPAPDATASSPPDASPTDASPTDASHAKRRRPKRRADAAPKKPDKPPKQPDKDPGKVKVTASPWAYVYVGGKKIGTTPRTISLPAGTHRIRVKNPELGTQKSKRVKVRSGRTIQVRFDLR